MGWNERMRFVLSAVYFAVPVTAFAQKPPIDTAVIYGWRQVANPAISNDGKYAAYSIVSTRAGAPRWMTLGIPASYRRIDDGLALDCQGGTPGSGLISSERKP